MKILVADDEKDLVELISQWLTRHGHAVSTAYDGTHALELIKQSDFDLAFLDLSMPEMTGMEIFEHIKQHKLRTKTVMITAYPLVEDFLLDAVGIDDFISKPFNFGEIERVIRKYQP